MSTQAMNQMKDKELDKSGVNNTESLPIVRRRVMALKKLQLEKLKVKGQLAREEFILSAKYKEKFRTFEEKSKQIITGEVEPIDEDCELSFGSMKGLAESLPPKSATDPNIRGVPGFWLKVLQSFAEINDWIAPKDEDVLNHLQDIEVSFDENSPQIVIKFSFGSNEYFSNSLLTKTYDIEFGPNPQSPWSRDDYYPIGRKGCRIDWKDGQNVTQKKTAKKVVKLNSFFDFFDDSLLKKPSKGDPKVEDIEDHLEEDWDLGLLVVKRVVPYAVLYYTQDLFEDESDSSDSSESDTDSSDGSNSSESQSD